MTHRIITYTGRAEGVIFQRDYENEYMRYALHSAEPRSRYLMWYFEQTGRFERTSHRIG